MNHFLTQFPFCGESLSRLRCSGWTVGETKEADRSGTVWIVRGRNGENLIDARCRSRDEAWWRACEQARSVGMLGPDTEP